MSVTTQNPQYLRNDQRMDVACAMSKEFGSISPNGAAAAACAPQTRFTSTPSSPSAADSHGTFGKKSMWNTSSRESKRRKDLKMRVVTQPAGPGWQRIARQTGQKARQGHQWKERLPDFATDLLARLYEALIMAKNCEVGRSSLQLATHPSTNLTH